MCNWFNMIVDDCHIFEAMVYMFSDTYFRFKVKKSSNLVTFGDILKNQGIG